MFIYRWQPDAQPSVNNLIQGRATNGSLSQNKKTLVPTSHPHAERWDRHQICEGSIYRNIPETLQVKKIPGQQIHDGKLDLAYTLLSTSE